MKKSIRILSVLMSLALIVSSFSFLPGTQLKTNAENAPANYITYDFSDDSFASGSILSQIPNTSTLGFFRPETSATADMYDNAEVKANVLAESEVGKDYNGKTDAFKVGDGGKYLYINANPVDGFKGSFNGGGYKNTAAFVDFSKYPAEGNYPIQSIAGTSTIVRGVADVVGDVAQNGTSFVIGKTYDEETKIATYLYVSIGMDEDYTYAKQSLANDFAMGIGCGTFTMDYSAENPFRGTPSLGAANNTVKHTIGVKKSVIHNAGLAALAVDANGNKLSAEQQTALVNYITANLKKATLTDAQRMMNFSLTAGKNDVAITVELPNLPGYAEYAALNDLPATFKIATTVDYVANKVTYEPYLGAIGIAANTQNQTPATRTLAVKNLALTYDISAYYVEVYKEIIFKFKTDTKELLSGYGLTVDKLSEVNAMLSEYDAWPEVVKESVKSDDEFVNMFTSLKKAKAAFEDGAYYFDSFDGAISYDVKAPISQTEEKGYGKNGTAPFLPAFDDNLKPTNTYSEEAVSREGNANGEAFWGIYSDLYNVSNNTLWIRKSFNALNIETGQQAWDYRWAQAKPSVHYVIKDGILPENAQIRSISGKMWLNEFASGGATAFTQIGVTYKYTNEYTWKNVGLSEAISGTQLNETTRSSENTGSQTNPANFVNRYEFVKGDKTVNFQKSQWLDFSLEYDFAYGRYVYSVTGINSTDGTLATLSIRLEEGDDLLKKVGFINASVCAQSFDDITVKLVDASYFDSEVSKLPSVDEVTADDENSIKVISSIYSMLSSEEREKVEKLSDFSAIIEKLEAILLVRDGKLPTDKIIDFETEETGEQYFTAQNSAGYANWGAVENPYKDSSNNSDKVLKVTKNFRAENASNTSGKAVYRMKDAVLNRDRLISNFTGKVYLDNNRNNQFASIVFDYQDADNWQAYKIKLHPNTNQIYIYREICENGVLTIPGGGSGTYFVFETATEPQLPAGLWVEFNVEYTLLTASLSLRFEHDGKQYIGEFPLSTTLFGTAETQVGFATEYTSYFDDIRLVFQGTNEYVLAQNFLKDNDYILDLVPFETYASVNEKPYYEALVNNYAELSDETKLYLPYMDTRVEYMGNIINAIPDDDEQAAADKQALENGKSTVGDYTNFTITEDFEGGLSMFMPAYDNTYNSGAVKIEYSEKLGSNALMIDGKTAVTIKEILLPEKPQLAKVKYKIVAGQQTTYQRRVKLFTNFVSDDEGAGLTYYDNFIETKDPITGEKITSSTGYFYKLQRMDGYDIGKAFDLEIDVVDVIEVEINYDAFGKYEIILKDSKGKNLVYPNSASVMSLFALGSLKTKVYIDDVSVTYRKGTYEVDRENKELTTYYTGNVMNNSGDYFTIEGENLGQNAFSVMMAPVANNYTANHGFVNQERFDYNGVQEGEFSIEPSAHNFNEALAVKVDIVQKTSNSIKLKIPEKFADNEVVDTAIYAVKLIDSTGNFRVIYINNPVIDYTIGTDGDIAVAGKTVRIIGKNLAPRGEKYTKVKIKGKGYNRVIPVAEVQSNYSISVELPAYLPNGEYELYVYNGYGDGTCWSIPTIITIGDDIRSTWKQDVFNVLEYGAVGDGATNDTPGFVNALNAAAKKGGGTVYLPAGAYILESEIIIPENVRFTGESVNTVSITVRPYNFLYNNMPPAIFNISSNVEISNISILASRISGVIMSPEVEAKNVYIKDIYFYSDPIAGAVSSAGNGLVGLLPLEEMQKMAIFESVNPIIIFQDYAKNVQVENADLGDHKLVSRFPFKNDRNGSSYWQIRGSSFFNGTGCEIIACNSIYENNTNNQSGVATWGHGYYVANNKFMNSMSNNRELWVADRNSLYRGTMIPVNKGENNTQFMIQASYSYKMQGTTQLYVVDGQGVGQTRSVIKTTAATVGGVNYVYLTIDRPFTIQPNTNSTVVFRRPRENIYFVDNYFENGSAGGFYGCCADVVYDNCKFKQVEKFYQWAIKNDVNWYMTFLNCEMEYQDTLEHVGTNGGAVRMGVTWYADSGVNAQLAFTMRGCVFDGQYTHIKANSVNCMSNIIIDNNCFMNYDYAIDFFNNKTSAQRTYENINGLLLSRNTYQNIDNVFNPEDNDLVAAAMKTTNDAASKRFMIIDDGAENTTTKKLGDVNGDGKITLKDATYVTYYYVGKLDLTLVQQVAADVNGDGFIDLKDSTLIKRYIMGYIDMFPAEGTPTPTPPEVDDPSFDEDINSDPTPDYVDETPFFDTTPDSEYTASYH